jgi:WD40 repeat protein
VHGIRTFGHWQERFAHFFANDPNITVLNYKFGFFSIASFVVPIFRWWVIWCFRRTLERELDRRPWDRVDIVAHSFGTLVAARALRAVARRRPSFALDTFICAGSVLPKSFGRSDPPIVRLANECGTRDLAAALGSQFILGIGNGGFAGFEGMTGGHFRNRFFRFGHSGFFGDAAGTPSDAFMKRHWLPLLRGSGAIPVHDERELSTGLRRAVLVALSALSPVKYFLYLSMVALPVYLHLQSGRERLFHLSSEARANDPTASFLYAAAAYRQLATPAALASLLASRSGGPFYLVASQGGAPVTLVRALDSGAIVAVRAGREAEIIGPDGVRRRIARLVKGWIDDVVGGAGDTGTLMVGREDGKVRVWGLDGSIVRSVPIFGATVAALSRDHRLLAVGQASGEVALSALDGSDGRTLGARGAAVRVVRFSADGGMLAAIAEDGSAHVWGVDGTAMGALPAEKGRPSRLDEDAGGAHIVATDRGGEDSNFWRRGLPFDNLSALEDHVTLLDAAFVENTAEVALAAADGSVRVWDLNSNRQERTNAHADWVCAVAAVPGGGFVTGSLDGTAKVFGGAQREQARLVGHRGFVRSVDAASDGVRLITGSYDGTVRVWRLDEDRDLRAMSRVQLGYPTVFSADARTVYTTRLGAAHPIYMPGMAPMYQHDHQVWEVTAGRPERLLLSRQLAFTDLAASPSGRFVSAIELYGNAVEVFDLARGTAPVALPHRWMPLAAAFAPDEKTVATGAADQAIRVWSLPSGKLVHDWQAHAGMIRSISFSADGKRLVSAADKLARIWSVRGDPGAKLQGHTDAVTSAMLSRDGRLVLTGSTDRTARIWDAEGRQLEVLRHPGEVVRVALAPDGQLALTLSTDGSARLWDRSGIELSRIHRSGSHILAAAFSPDGRRVVAAFSDGTVESRVIDGQELLKIAAELERARRR